VENSREGSFWRVVLLFSSAGEQRQYTSPVIFRIVSSVKSIILGGVVSFSIWLCYLLPGVISGGFRLVRGVSTDTPQQDANNKDFNHCTKLLLLSVVTSMQCF
jgi:hypothetical protein